MGLEPPAQGVPFSANDCGTRFGPEIIPIKPKSTAEFGAITEL